MAAAAFNGRRLAMSDAATTPGNNLGTNTAGTTTTGTSATSDTGRTTQTEVLRAPATLIYVPGLGYDTLDTAEVIADSIAKEADRKRRGRVVADATHTPAATPGLRRVKTIQTEDGTRLLDVTELDYRGALEGLAQSKKPGQTGKEGVAPGLWRQGLYTLRGSWYWLRAADHHEKSSMAKFQLGYGLAAMLLLITVFLVTLAGTIATVFTQLGWDLPNWMVDVAPWVALTGGLLSAASLTKLRANLLRGGRRLQQVMRYFDEQYERHRITDLVTDAVDGLDDIGYTGDIHVLAYSFGALVTLDAYSTDAAEKPTSDQVDNGVVVTKSIVTVGCPADIVKFYKPEHYKGRQALRTDLPWDNVFIAADVFGSNFQPDDDKKVARATVLGGWTVTNHPCGNNEPLTFWSVVLEWAGLRQHNQYWNSDGGPWDPVLVRWGLAKPAATSPSASPHPFP
jgi:hypothetical protein